MHLRSRSLQCGWGILANTFLVIGLVLVAAIGLFVYGQRWPRQFQARVPSTNMTDVQQAVGKPVHAKTNGDGSVLWDYTKFWSGTARVYFNTNGNYIRTFTEW